MKAIARLICLLAILSLTACGGAEEEHAHEKGSAAHSHDGGEAHPHEGEDAHEYADGGHAHDAPETEAFYGDDVGAADATQGAEPTAEEKETAETHSHDDGEPHSHDH